MIKNETVSVVIENLGINGEGIATLPDGMKMFVPFALEGETVQAKVLSVKRQFCYGRIQSIAVPSPHRVAPRCPVFGRCGGCVLQHLDYRCHADYKRKLVADALDKIAHTPFKPEPTVTAGSPFFYRNKIQLPVGVNASGQTVVGFFRTNSHDIVPITTCPLHGAWADKLIACFHRFAREQSITGYDIQNHRGDVRHIVAREYDGRILICLVVPKPLPAIARFGEILKESFSDFSLLQNQNDSPTNLILGSRTLPVLGENRLEIFFSGLKADISVESFLQVNLPVAERVYEEVVAACAADKNTVIIDAFSGAGILSALLSRHAAKVYGLEICSEATHDADRLAQKNNLTNLENRNGDCAALLPRLVEELNRAFPAYRRVVVLDPPRKGCDERVLAAVVAASFERIVYVSCNPATLARDLSFLTANNAYQIARVTPFDMFPQTAHVETVAVLIRANDKLMTNDK